MKLIWALLAWLFRKTTIIGFLILVLTLMYFTWDILSPLLPSIKDYSTRLQELYNAYDDVRGKVSATSNQIRQLQREMQMRQAQGRPAWYKPWERIQYDAEADILKLQNKLNNLRAEQLNIQNKILGLQKSTGGIVNKYWIMLKNAFMRNIFRILYIVGLVLFGPVIWKIWWYYGMGEYAQQAPPIQIHHPDSPGVLSTTLPSRTIGVNIDPQTPLLVRGHTSHYDQRLMKRTRLLWKWKSPFISYTAGLFELTEFSAKSESEGGMVELSSEVEGQYLTEIRLQDHPGVVIHPHHIIAVAGDIHVKTQWKLQYLHSWLTGQLRYIIFYGTGSIYIAGAGGVNAVEVHPGTLKRVEQRFVLGFDTRLAYSTARTETFWPYFKNRALLVDDQFSGEGLFFYQVYATAKEQTAVEKNFQFLMTFMQALGKFFGF